MSGVWEANLCSCFNLLPVCAISCFCPCIVQGISIWELNQSGGCGECLMGCTCLCVGLALNRNRIRKVYRIKGNCIADCLGFFFCYPCLTTQEFIHITRSKYKDRHDQDNS